MMVTTRSNLRETLSAADFPASKEQLVVFAENHGGDQDTVAALRAMPLADYDNIEQVLRSVQLDKGTEKGQTDSDKAEQARRHTQSGLAEHQTEVPPHPITDELGENRGS